MNYTLRNETLEEIQRRLSSIFRERDQRPGLLAYKGQKELAWIVHERTQLHLIVNELRSRYGKEALPIEDIERVENSAKGHVDYATKLALGATELVTERA